MTPSVIIIAKNAEKVIIDCLRSVDWADEIIVIDDQSDDKTVEVAEKMGVKVYVHKMKNFADQREFALRQAQGKWVLYVDVDERVTKELKSEILTLFKAQGSRPKENIVAYKIPRKNYYLGNFEWPMIEHIERLFLKKTLRGWRGPIHESPIVDGKIGELKNYLLHYTHQNLSSMIKKTNQWSEIEAELLFKANHPEMTWWRFLRVMLIKFWNSYIGQGGWKVGVPGLIESIYQSFSYFIVYAKLWEKQQKT